MNNREKIADEKLQNILLELQKNNGLVTTQGYVFQIRSKRWENGNGTLQVNCVLEHPQSNILGALLWFGVHSGYSDGIQCELCTDSPPRNIEQVLKSDEFKIEDHMNGAFSTYFHGWEKGLTVFEAICSNIIIIPLTPSIKEQKTKSRNDSYSSSMFSGH